MSGAITVAAIQMRMRLLTTTQIMNTRKQRIPGVLGNYILKKLDLECVSADGRRTGSFSQSLSGSFRGLGDVSRVGSNDSGGLRPGSVGGWRDGSSRGPGGTGGMTAGMSEEKGQRYEQDRSERRASERTERGERGERERVGRSRERGQFIRDRVDGSGSRGASRERGDKSERGDRSHSRGREDKDHARVLGAIGALKALNALNALEEADPDVTPVLVMKPCHTGDHSERMPTPTKAASFHGRQESHTTRQTHLEILIKDLPSLRPVILNNGGGGRRHSDTSYSSFLSLVTEAEADQMIIKKNRMIAESAVAAAEKIIYGDTKR